MSTRVAILWHMHQPMYTDPETGDVLLPWVRLHATRAYYDMGRMLERHPDVNVTVNYVPSLVEQLEAAAAGTARDRYLQLMRTPAQELDDDQRAFVLRHFFMIDHERWINPVPRYRELLRKRGSDPQAIEVSRYTDDDLRDLQVLFPLAWMGFSARSDFPEIATLLAKGGGYSESDKETLLDIQQRIVAGVLPLWRKLGESGQVELSTTPYYHPILPLLCDSDSARRALPQSRLPPRFHHPEDAREQVRLALSLHERVFGKRPGGMWPAEGSVSPEAVEILAAEGLRWVATDEGNLFRSSPPPGNHGELYQGFSLDTAGGRIAIAFRDRPMSDRIGFSYARMSAQEAVADFLSLAERAREEATGAGIESPLLPIILDGENAWERYEDGGEAFLDGLYSALGREPFTTITLSDALANPSGHLRSLHSGSWIESSFRIWIGHPEDNLAWELLGAVRRMLAEHEARRDVPDHALSRARELLYQAEGSDWFWWYGDDFQSDNAADFDALFRRRLLLAARCLGEIPPSRLLEPLSAQARSQGTPGFEPRRPTGIISPRWDDGPGSFNDWLGAGRLTNEGGGGSMFRSERLLSALHYGFDHERLFLRLDPVGDDFSCSHLRLVFRSASRHQEQVLEIELSKPGALTLELAGAQGRWRDSIELSLPLQALSATPGQPLELTVVCLKDDRELDRLPQAGSLVMDVPDEDFMARHWVV